MTRGIGRTPSSLTRSHTGGKGSGGSTNTQNWYRKDPEGIEVRISQIGWGDVVEGHSFVASVSLYLDLW